MLKLYREIGQSIDFYQKPELKKFLTMTVDGLDKQFVVISTENLETGEKQVYNIRKGGSIKLHDSVHVTVKQLLKSTVIFDFIVDDDIKVLRSELKLFK